MSRYRFTFQLLILAVTGTSILLALGFFGAFHPALDSLGHFRAHLAVLTALLALPLLVSNFRLLAFSALVFALAAFSTTSNALSHLGLGTVQAGFEARGEDRAVYRLMQMNLRFDNPTPEKVLSLIGRTQPDVITLNEVSAMWKQKLGLLQGAYPHRIVCPFPNGAFGVAILSRRPFAPGTLARCLGHGTMAVATVDFGGSEVDVGAIHLGWPWPFEQPRQIRMLSEPLSSLSQTSILAGDCNATPWSGAVRQVAEAGGLKLMASVGPTWLYIKLPDFLRFAGLPIDQVFSKGDILIHSAERLEDTGSDHLPMVVEFSIRPGKQQPEETRRSAIASTAGRGAGANRI